MPINMKEKKEIDINLHIIKKKTHGKPAKNTLYFMTESVHVHHLLHNDYAANYSTSYFNFMEIETKSAENIVKTVVTCT